MTITREQLGLAAKAARLELYECDTLGLCVKLKAGQLAYDVVQWRPNIDHGQLLDLAMACKMEIDFQYGCLIYWRLGADYGEKKFSPKDFPSLAEAVITAAAEQQQAKETKE